jgi:GNAT superfamily N-acetyltransferase
LARVSHVLRGMLASDLVAADRLRDQAGWNQAPGDWQRLLAWQPGGCFVAEDADGNIHGTVTTTPFAGAIGTAWVGMVLVDQSVRRQGLGRALLTSAVDWLEHHNVGMIGLDASPVGKTLYDRTGFTDVYTLQRQHAVVPEVLSPSGVTPLRSDDLARIAELDSAAFFGLDRQRILRDLQRAHPPGGWLKEDANGRIEGYVLSRPGARAWYVGPLVARDADTAEILLRAALAPLSGQPAILDTLDPNPYAGGLASKYGFELRRPFIRMTRGVPAPASRTDWYFAMAGPEIG